MISASEWAEIAGEQGEVATIERLISHVEQAHDALDALFGLTDHAERAFMLARHALRAARDAEKRWQDERDEIGREA